VILWIMFLHCVKSSVRTLFFVVVLSRFTLFPCWIQSIKSVPCTINKSVIVWAFALPKKYFKKCVVNYHVKFSQMSHHFCYFQKTFCGLQKGQINFHCGFHLCLYVLFRWVVLKTQLDTWQTYNAIITSWLNASS